MRNTVLLLLLALCIVSQKAIAQTGDKAAAEALFDAGKQLLDEGRFTEACPKLAESQRLDPAPGTLLNLADCYEKAGMSASAWATWLEAAAAAKTAGQTKREELARQRASALKTRLVSVTITVPESSRIPGLEIARDGVPVGLAMWATAVPVDPGTHAVVAHAPGRRTWQTAVTVVDGSQPVQVTVPILEKEQVALDRPVVPAAPTAAPVVPIPGAAVQPATASNAPATVRTAPSATTPTVPIASTSKSPTPESTTTDTKPGSIQRTLGYVAAGVGAIGVAVGSVYGLKAISKNNDSRAECRTDTLCSAKGVSLRDEAFNAASASTIGFGVGAIGLVTGVLLLVTAPPSAESSPNRVPAKSGVESLQIATVFGSRYSVVSLKGAF